MRFALLLGVALSLMTTSAVAQNCDGFADVLASDPFCPDVTWMKTTGITKGCDPTHYCPNGNVSRLQLAVFLHRLSNNPAFAQGGNAFSALAVLGTTDNNSLEVIVNNQRAMIVQPVLDPIDGFNPNVVNGASTNSVPGGVAGATIAGGGGCNPGAGVSCTSASGNQVTSVFGTVGGGATNTAAAHATVAGGMANKAKGIGSAVAGGDANTAGGQNSAIAGGFQNTANGDFSTVAGGSGNAASGTGSFAAGSSANATHDYSFVWGDGTQAANSTGTHTFSVLATGGIGLYPGNAQVNINWGGGWSCTVNSGSSNWACSSDRNLKENFQTLDPRDVLRRLVEMPVTSWTFIGHPDLRHIGPVAQDFHATFGLGDANDDTHIDIGDSQGVALAAIQGLNAKVEEQAVTIGGQQREIVELRERISAAESLGGELAALRSALAEILQERLVAAQRN